MTFVLVVENEESISDALFCVVHKEGFEIAAWLPARPAWMRSTTSDRVGRLIRAWVPA